MFAAARFFARTDQTRNKPDPKAPRKEKSPTPGWARAGAQVAMAKNYPARVKERQPANAGRLAGLVDLAGPYSPKNQPLWYLYPNYPENILMWREICPTTCLCLRHNVPAGRLDVG